MKKEKSRTFLLSASLNEICDIFPVVDDAGSSKSWVMYWWLYKS